MRSDRTLLPVVLGLAALLASTAAQPATNCAAGTPNTTTLPESTPTTDFTDHGNGTVTHTLTGLMWKRCAQGKTWSGTTCTGTASEFTWADALTQAKNETYPASGYTDWRLPSIKELQTLHESCGYRPAMNQVVFPTISALDSLLSATTDASDAVSAWYLSVNYGDVGNGSTKTDPYSFVLLVRGGRSFNTFDSRAGYTPTTPSFTAQTGVALSSTITSNTITLAGLTTVTGIKISNGSYQVNSGSYTTSPGVVSNGDTVTVRQTASGSNGTVTTATLTVGGVNAAFDVTTLGVPAQPVMTSITPGNSQASLAFATPADNGAALSGYAVNITPSGGSAVTLNVGVGDGATVTSGGLTATVAVSGSTTRIAVTGLSNGASYAFTVAASNSVGAGVSSASQSATPADVPSQPTVTATPTYGQASLAFATPADNGAALSGYAVNITPSGGSAVTLNVGASDGATVTTGGLTATVAVSGSNTRITVTGLSNGTAYAFTVAATNSSGTGVASTAVNAVIPVYPSYSTYSTPTPSTISCGAGQDVYLSGNTPVQAGAGSNLIIPSLSSVVGTTIGLIQGATSTAPVTLKIGGKVLTLQSADPNAQVKIGKVSRNGVDVAVLIVTTGTVTVSAEAGQPLVAVGASGMVVSAGEQGGALKSAASNGAASLLVTEGYVILPEGAFAGTGTGNNFAALRDGKVYAGEVAEIDPSGKLKQVRLGSLAGSGALGDPLKPATVAGLEVMASAPDLKGKVARISETNDFTAALAAALGKEVTAQGQNADGVLSLGFPGGKIQALPYGNITIDTSRPDGVTLTAANRAEIARSGVITRFAPTVGDFAAFAASLAKLDKDALVAVQEDGMIHLRFKGAIYPLQPAWTVAQDKDGQAGLSTDEQGMFVYRDDAGNRQVLYPVFADLPRLTAIFKALDATAGVTSNGDGTATARFQGKDYVLKPEYRLTSAPTKLVDKDWWPSGDKVFIRNGDGSAQGFAVK